MVELGRSRFKSGERGGKPYGGNVSDDPFSQALHKSAVSSGFESQSDLAKVLEISPTTVSGWYRGNSTPSPMLFGDLLVLFDQNDKEREPLVEAYANRLVKRDKLKAENHRRDIMPSSSPFGKWVEATCEEKNITIKQFAHMLGLDQLRRNSVGLWTLKHIRQNAKEAFGLSEKQGSSLNRLISREINGRKKAGHRFQDSVPGSQLIKEQKKLIYRTYNGQEAATVLGITRARVSQLHKKFELPALLTDDHIEMLRIYLESTKILREKIRKGREEKKSGSLDQEGTIFQSSRLVS